MDGLSTVASIVAVLQLTGAVIGYLNDVKDAPKECQQCTIEASNIQNLLINLRYRLEQGHNAEPWFTAVRALHVENGPLDQYKQALEQLRSKLEVQDRVQKVKRRLLWKFGKEEVKSILARIERLKSLITFALEIDHFKLSLAIKEDISSLPILHANAMTEQHHKILQWLSPTDFPAQQHDIISRRQKGTGQWLLDSREFKGWLQGSNRTLLCPGIPGAGKTMMAAIAIEHLGRTANADVGLAYLFCNYKSQVDQSEHGLLSALLKQLLQSRLDIAAPVTSLYDHYSKKNIRPSSDEIFTALSTICSNHTGVYLVVDALDECSDHNRTRSRLIERLRDLQAKTNVRLLYTSRPIPEIEEKFRLDPRLEIRATEEDVKRFIEAQIPRLPNCIKRDDELRRAVQSKISAAVDGMFLLARLHVDSLLDKKTKRQVQSTLEKLLKGSAALDQAYKDAIDRIDGQLEGDRSLARKTISWVSYAQRPLTTQELCSALAIELGDTGLDDGNVYDVEEVISVCAGLVTIDEESNVIRLVHYTTQEYFERIRLDWNPSAQQEIASVCLTYLTFDAFRTGSCGTDRDFEERKRKNVFLDYAARYWAEHVNPVEEIVSDLALEFLQDNACVSCSTQMISMQGYHLAEYSQWIPDATTGLHLSARFGLVSLSKILLTTIDVESKDGYSQTPLSWAAAEGHEAVVKLLLGTGKVDVESKDKRGRTLLSLAAREGHEAVVKLLLETGKVDVESTDIYGRTPLSYTAWGGHEAVVKLLLETGKAEVESKDMCGWTPLSLAAREGREAVVKLLLETGKVDVESKDNIGQTPLSWATLEGHEAVVKLLLETGKVDVESKDKDGRTPLWWAAAGGHEAVVKLLLGTGKVDVESKDNIGQTPLSRAAKRGHEAVVKLLVETGKVDVESKDKNGRTPLWWAAWGGYEAVVKLLETGKVDVES